MPKYTGNSLEVDGIKASGGTSPSLLLEHQNGGTGRGIRLYSDPDGLVVTRNARWTGSVWTRDITGEATYHELGDYGNTSIVRSRYAASGSGDITWNDDHNIGKWTIVYKDEVVGGNSAISFQTLPDTAGYYLNDSGDVSVYLSGLKTGDVVEAWCGVSADVGAATGVTVYLELDDGSLNQMTGSRQEHEITGVRHLIHTYGKFTMTSDTGVTIKVKLLNIGAGSTLLYGQYFLRAVARRP